MAAPLILGAVCRTWRQIAWSTPELWNSMFFEFWTDQCDDDALRMELVKEWLARSGDLPLNICTQCRRRKARRAPVASLFPLVDILNSYANRWQVLNLHAPSALLARFDPSSMIPEGSGLAELTIEPADYSLACPVNLMSATTTLRKLTIAGIPPSLVHVHFDQIMHLSTWYLSSDKCLWLLCLTPRLEECTFATMDRARRDLPSDHFAVPNLRQLAFKGSWERRLDVFLDKLDLPSLQRLEISAKVDLEPPLDLASHFARWHCPLKMLSLSCCETRGMDMKDMLSQITTLEYLKLSLSEGSSVACDVL
ncbi:hypothetical protein NLJ89_g7234 [Agrocybe chaxingu]|uniref:F-box domain-containing protein n=1 Tax=Agrocybe chaxingu TaxID=84603 RepID=A0A9W8K4V3_9AGAR|nr:hypothetical protein NLJ89_g7234 [Agrocybe chaxingu]